MNLPIKKLDDFITVYKKYRKGFGIQDKIFYSKEFNGRIEKDPKFAQCFDNVTSADLNLAKTKMGRVLGFFEEKNSMEYRINHDPKYKGLAVHPFIVGKGEVYFGVSKKIKKGYLARLKKAYQKLVQNGTFAKIAARVW